MSTTTYYYKLLHFALFSLCLQKLGIAAQLAPITLLCFALLWCTPLFSVSASFHRHKRFHMRRDGEKRRRLKFVPPGCCGLTCSAVMRYSCARQSKTTATTSVRDSLRSPCLRRRTGWLMDSSTDSREKSFCQRRYQVITRTRLRLQHSVRSIRPLYHHHFGDATPRYICTCSSTQTKQETLLCESIS